MKLKIVSIILSVVLLLFIIYGVVATMAVNEVRNEWSVKYSELSDDYKEVSEKYQELLSEQVNVEHIITQSIISTIDENASFSLYDESVLNVVVSESADIKDKVSENLYMIKGILSEYDYKSCVISVIDSDGKCSFGWTVLPSGESFVFMSE